MDHCDSRDATGHPVKVTITSSDHVHNGDKSHIKAVAIRFTGTPRDREVTCLASDQHVTPDRQDRNPLASRVTRDRFIVLAISPSGQEQPICPNKWCKTHFIYLLDWSTTSLGARRYINVK